MSTSITVNLDPAKSLVPRIEVPRPLSDEQVNSYVNDGYVVIPGVVSRAEIDEVAADIVTLLRGGYNCPALQPLPAEMSDRDVMNSFLGILQPHFVSPVILRYVKHPQISGMLSQLVGAHLPFWDGSVKCMQSMVFTKPPDFPGQAWHQDELYIPTRDHSLCGAWVALDDATVENGCLYVIPQSHRMGYLYPQEPHDRPGEWDFAPRSYGFDDSVAIPVEVKAGDVIFFNGYLLHASFKNRSRIYRRALVNHYMSSWSILPWGGKDDDRRVVPVAGLDPYAWKGYEPLPRDGVWIRPLEQRAAS
jgi:hypothetical protein